MTWQGKNNHLDHPYEDPKDGRAECKTCGKWVWLVTHSCKGVKVSAKLSLNEGV